MTLSSYHLDLFNSYIAVINDLWEGKSTLCLHPDDTSLLGSHVCVKLMWLVVLQNPRNMLDLVCSSRTLSKQWDVLWKYQHALFHRFGSRILIVLWWHSVLDPTVAPLRWSVQAMFVLILCFRANTALTCGLMLRWLFSLSLYLPLYPPLDSPPLALLSPKTLQGKAI